jgi:hypothetical protein
VGLGFTVPNRESEAGEVDDRVRSPVWTHLQPFHSIYTNKMSEFLAFAHEKRGNYIVNVTKNGARGSDEPPTTS